MDNLSVIKVLTEVGSIGVSIALIIYLIKKLNADKAEKAEYFALMRDFNKSINNHMQHEELSHEKQAEAMNGLGRAISGLSEIIRGCPNNKINK